MRRTLAFTLALVVVVSASAVAVPAGGQQYTQIAPIVPANNTTAYLTIATEDLERTGYGTASLDVGAALDAQNEGLHARWGALSLEERLAVASGAAEQRSILQSELDQLAAAVSALEQRKRDALAAYNSDALTTDELVRELAAIALVADSLEDRLDSLEAAANDIQDTRIEKGLRGLQVSLLELRGPVREHSSLVVEGRATPRTVYVETSDRGVVLATIAGDEYIREVSIPTARDPDASDQYSGNLDRVEERAEELHPWAVNHSRGRNYGSLEFGFVGVYPIELPHIHGTLRSYLDGGTGDVFYETQTKDLDEIPTNAPMTSGDDGLTLTVETTHPSGPMNVTLVDASTGDPVDATLTIDGQQVGTTGEDGTTWLIQPRGGGTLVASVGGNSVQLQLA
ncbi:DUF7094 domain-containing protein [Haladaptatus sp. CMSO5]|uniref:DUF7094 domain-containing protein n=1 Tax=Haladaptatus sp. CMSO5 TaxID=3120514 RepID=UPI002FCE641E